MRSDMSAEKSQPLLPSERDPHAEGKLPNADLNPMTNPTLGRNLGKWAQVYFTNPPEKRDHAVSELLRELEGSLRTDAGLDGNFSDPLPEDNAEPNEPSAKDETSGSPAAASTLSCPQCERNNVPDQWFCGYCGFPLRGTAPSFARRGDPLHPDNGPARVPQSPTSRMSDAQQTDLEWLREKSLSSFGSYNKVSHPLRKLLVLALIIGLSGFLYLQWQRRTGVQSSPGPSPDASRRAIAPPAAPKAEAGAHRDALSAKNARPAPGLVPGNSAEKAESPRTRTAAFVEPKAAPPLSTVAPAGQELGVASRDTGEREFVIAETYLKSGASARDAHEAAQWLWKSVAKHNAAALVLLADLYQRGDGVSKSCDQAQVLLVAAAKRGSPEAGQKLRNLQRSGCK